MFGMKGKPKASQGPYRIKNSLSRVIGGEWGKLPEPGDHWVEYLAVSRPNPENKQHLSVRIFDKWCADQKKVAVQDFSSLDVHPDLILMEGWYDRKSRTGNIKAKAA
jgi:hypothetical protein